MSEESENVVQVDPKIEAEAKSMGWVPKEQFRGSPDKWTDAESFVTKGKEYIPFIKATNKKLAEQLSHLTGENQALANRLAASDEAIADLKKYQDENTRRAVEDSKKRILKDLAQAKKDEDVDAEVALTDQLTEVNAALKEKPKEEVKKETPRPRLEVDPTFTTWLAEPENSWFQTDSRKQALAVQIARELRLSGSKLEGKAFFDKVGEEVHEFLGSKVSPAPAADKVNGSRGGSGGGGGDGSSGKSYKDLPTDAKKACDKFALTLVGTGRAFKDEAAWRAKYVSDYFKE